MTNTKSLFNYIHEPDLNQILSYFFQEFWEIVGSLARFQSWQREKILSNRFAVFRKFKLVRIKIKEKPSNNMLKIGCPYEAFTKRRSRIQTKSN